MGGGAEEEQEENQVRKNRRRWLRTKEIRDGNVKRKRELMSRKRSCNRRRRKRGDAVLRIKKQDRNEKYESLSESLTAIKLQIKL